MRIHLSITLSALVTFCTFSAFAAQTQALSRSHDTQVKNCVDTSAPPESRVQAASPSLVKKFTDARLPPPIQHTLTAAEKQKLSAAFAALTPLQRTILEKRLRSISFLDGMPNNALTETSRSGDGCDVYDVTFRAGMFNETVSQLVTKKEQTLFNTTGTNLTVSVNAGSMDAIVYVLLHEATHIVDGVLGITSPNDTDPPKSSFTRNAWSQRLLPLPQYRTELLQSIRYRSDGKVLDIKQAGEVYTALSHTPFVSLYGSNNWYDDLAEFVAWYELTQKLGQPYQIEIRDNGNLIHAYDPMKFPLVRARFEQLDIFYAGE